MDSENSITLVTEFCKTFVSQTESDIVSVTTIEKLKKIIFTELFTFRNKTDDDLHSINDPLLLIRMELLSCMLKYNYSRKHWKEQIDKKLTDLQKLFEECENKDYLNLVFLFLYKLSKFKSYENNMTCHDSNIVHDIKYIELFSNGNNANYIDWRIFHDEPLEIKSNVKYPFYENPGTGIQFLKDYCPEYEHFNCSFTNMYDGKYKIWRFDLNKEADGVVQDESFVAPGSEFGSKEESIDTDGTSNNSVNSEDLVNEFDKLGTRTWTHLGNCKPPREPPFSSENLECIVHFWKISNTSYNTNTKTVPIGVQTTFTELKSDLKYLLFGMPSSSFYYNKETRTFCIRDKLHLSTLTPQIVSDFCEPFMECAYYYHSLKMFVNERLILPFGLVHKVFCRCVRQVLNLYVYCFLNMKWESIRYMSQFETTVVPMKQKLMFVANLCFITMKNESATLQFPSGVQLLDYLYDNLTKVHRTDLNYILFHIFESCCNAYFQIVSEWILNGCFSNANNYEEFFIEIQREHEMFRDWRRVSCIKIKEQFIPKFLQTFYKDIFICGKSINLLKICSSQEILDTVFPKDYPSLICCFNQQQVAEYSQTWNTFDTANDHNFNSLDMIKRKLFKKYDSPEFLKDLTRTRQNWLVQYEKYSENAIKHGSELCTEIQQQNIIIERDERAQNKELDRKVRGDDGSGDNETSICDGQKTKQLISFYENLNNSSPNMQKECVERETSKITSPLNDSRKEQSCSELAENRNQSVENLHQDFDSPNRSAKIQFAEITAQKSKAAVNQIADVVNENATTLSKQTTEIYPENAKNRIINTRALAIHDCVGAAGDFATQIQFGQNLSARIKNGTTMHLGGGDGDCDASNVTTSSVVVTSLIVRKENEWDRTNTLSELAKNRLRVMSSEYHNRLNESVDNIKSVPAAPMTDCERNKLNAMSSEYHTRLSTGFKLMSNECHNRLDELVDSTKFVPVIKTNPSMTDCERNKLKVMSSEYHTRLNTANDEIKTVERELTECEKNKMKVMTSEYHLRLGGRERAEFFEKTLNELNDRELKKPKVMSSEYHDQLKTLLDKKVDSEPEIKPIKEVKTSPHRTETEPEIKSESNQKEESIVRRGEELQEKREPSNVSKEKRNEFILENYCSTYNNVMLGDTKSIDDLRTAAESVRDVDVTSLFYYLSQSVSIPLKIQSRLVNEAILRIFIEEECYLNHLMALKDYMLLRKPEFSLSLTNLIFKMMEKNKKPYYLLNNYALSSILQQSLLVTNSKEMMQYGKKLSFVIENIPDSFDLVDIKVLNCLSFNYSVKWPINILITEEIMKKYSKVFKFLMQLQFALWVLKKDFVNLKNLKFGKSILYTQIQLYRHNMTQIIRIFQEYVTREGLVRCWNHLVEELTNADINLESLYMLHLKYINKIIQRCFLCDISSSCYNSILNLFSTVLKYHQSLRVGSWRRNVEVNFLYHTNFRNLQEIYKEFNSTLNEVLLNLKILVHNKQRVYLEPLYQELCNNSKFKIEV